MHELGVASSILEQVEAEAARRPGAHITNVGVRIGELSGVDPDALRFSFKALIKGTEWEPLALELESVPRRQRCSQCHHEFRMTDFDPQCPLCGDCFTTCISGQELDIAYMEVEE
jgi:hydrogenase nickel incorporation protein HypA/HybF